MPDSTASANPNSLHAILLVTRTRAGPRVLLHYPPAPGQDHGATAQPRETPYRSLGGDLSNSPLGSGFSETATQEKLELNSEKNGSGLSDRLSDYTNTTLKYDPNTIPPRPFTAFEPESPRSSASHMAPRPATAAAFAMGSPEQHLTSSTHASQQQEPQNFHSSRFQQTWKEVLGFPADGLARMLAPTGRAWHKRRLELQLRNLSFVGCPVHEKPEGGWRKVKRKRVNASSDAVQDEAEDSTKNDDDETGNGASLAYSNCIPTYGSPGHNSVSVSATSIPGAANAREADEPAPGTSFATVSSSLISSSNSNHGGGIDGLLTSVPDTLHMFNIVFVSSISPAFPQHPGGASSLTSDPPIAVDALHSAEAMPHQRRTGELYVHCVKKLARALQLRQKKGSYVWNEVRKIISVREKAREAGTSYAATWPILYNASSLVRALAAAFTGINHSSIAHLNLGSLVSISLQLPQRKDTSRLPTPTAPISSPQSALWLTTFSPYLQDGDNNIQHGNTGHSATISPASALILLMPAETLLGEIAASPTSPLAAALTYYIRHCRPTKTLSQFARKSRLSLQNVQLLSLHLIHWRRARAIPPLHHTNTYMVSPLVDWSTFEDACAVFRARFSALPSLPNILARLSAITTTAKTGLQSWGRLMPSPDHKEAYMDMLEWLVRSGWVTQLRTFAWVVVSPEVKAIVARKMRKEEKDAAIVAAEDALLENTDLVDEPSSINSAGMGMASGYGAAMTAPATGVESSKQRRKSSQGSASLLSPHLKPRLQVPRRTSEAGSVSSVSTALRVPLRSGLRVDSQSPVPGRKGSEHAHRLSDGSSVPPNKIRGRCSDSIAASDIAAAAATADAGVDASMFESSIVISPHKANALESRWLEHIGSMQDPEVQELWPRLIIYFDGLHAVEEIAMQEGIKRKVLSPVLARLMGDAGVLRTARHW